MLFACEDIKSGLTMPSKTETLAAEAIDIAKATGKDWDWNDFAAVAEEIEAEVKEKKE